jgi:mannan endo-1,6-alpha-mannosidase
MKDICEQNNACNVDQHSFKAYLSRWMSATTQMAPWTYDIIAPLLLSSAKAATAQCTGAPTGNVCGLKWYNNGTWDGTAGVGQQMAALEVVLGTMVGHATPAVTNTTGGNSASNPSAGYNASSLPPGEVVTPASKADRAGGWFLTVLFSLATLYMWYFMNTSSCEWRSKPTVGGKTGRHGRTISTMDIGSSGSTVVAGAGAVEKERGLANGKETPNGNGNGNGNGNAEKRHSNLLTKNQPDRASVFSSTGVFPSDAANVNGHRKSASYGGQRHSVRSLPPIAEKDARERERERRRRRSSGVNSARERHVESRFREEAVPGGGRLD